MEMFVHEFALLVVAITPFAILFSIHAGLMAAGERDTLLIPVMRDYPALEYEVPAAAEMPAPMPTIPQNDMDFRLAA
jgi:hypothetical protein